MKPPNCTGHNSMEEVLNRWVWSHKIRCVFTVAAVRSTNKHAAAEGLARRNCILYSQPEPYLTNCVVGYASKIIPLLFPLFSYSFFSSFPAEFLFFCTNSWECSALLIHETWFFVSLCHIWTVAVQITENRGSGAEYCNIEWGRLTFPKAKHYVYVVLFPAWCIAYFKNDDSRIIESMASLSLVPLRTAHIFSPPFLL